MCRRELNVFETLQFRVQILVHTGLGDWWLEELHLLTTLTLRSLSCIE